MGVGPLTPNPPQSTLLPKPGFHRHCAHSQTVHIHRLCTFTVHIHSAHSQYTFTVQIHSSHSQTVTFTDSAHSLCKFTDCAHPVHQNQQTNSSTDFLKQDRPHRKDLLLRKE